MIVPVVSDISFSSSLRRGESVRRCIFFFSFDNHTNRAPGTSTNEHKLKVLRNVYQSTHLSNTPSDKCVRPFNIFTIIDLLLIDKLFANNNQQTNSTINSKPSISICRSSVIGIIRKQRTKFSCSIIFDAILFVDVTISTKGQHVRAGKKLFCHLPENTLQLHRYTETSSEVIPFSEKSQIFN